MEKLTKKGLDGTQLKTIALVLMVLDHIHYFFEFTGCIPTVFSMLGRLSAMGWTVPSSRPLHWR